MQTYSKTNSTNQPESPQNPNSTFVNTPSSNASKKKKKNVFAKSVSKSIHPKKEQTLLLR